MEVQASPSEPSAEALKSQITLSQVADLKVWLDIMLACNLDSGIVTAMVDMCTNPDKKLFSRHILINIATSAFMHRAR
jgi:hypothetical protein